MMKMKEIIVVEGIHDKQAIDRAVAADCLISGGSAVSEEFLAQVERAMRERGVIIFTDPDQAGERIRRIIAQRVPGCKHAFLPREEARADNGDIGIENASPESIRQALSHVRSEEKEWQAAIRWEDMILLGLAGSAEASRRRRLLGERLHIGYGNAKTFWKRLNMLGVTREELREAYAALERDESREEEKKRRNET